MSDNQLREPAFWVGVKYAALICLPFWALLVILLGVLR